MIAQLTTPQRRKRFAAACRGKPALGTFMQLDAALFAQSQPWRFYAAPTLALELSGTTAWAAGHANPEELAGFLHFCGCGQVILDETVCLPPTGWQRAETLTVFGLRPGKALPLPDASGTAGELTLDREPSAAGVAEVLYPEQPERQADFYSELCTKRARGKARVWALRQDGCIVCTVGAYALDRGTAYLACGQTSEPLRGRGIGGRLIVQAANELAAEGLQPVFLCAPERVHFYTRLGFEKRGEYARYMAPAAQEPQETERRD